MDEDLSTVPGHEAVVKHFGRWPSFHDAVVQQLSLNLPGETLLTLRSWNISSETDESGYYKTTHHGLVKILLTDICELDVAGGDLQAGCILFGLELSKEGESYRLVLDPAFGLGGTIKCRGVRLEIYPE